MARVEWEKATATPPLPRRVMHVLNSAGGGAAMSTIDLIRSFHQLGVDSVAVCHDMGTDLDRQRLSECVEGRVLFTPLYWWNRKSRAAAWKRPILELMQLRATGWRRGAERKVTEFAHRHRAELIHTNTFVTPEGARAARDIGIPHVWHVRELVGPGTPYRFAGEGEGIRKFLQRHPSLVVANSNVTARHIRTWVPEGVLRIVPNGIDVGRFTGIGRGESSRPVVAGMVAGSATWKKHDLLFEIAGLVAESAEVEFHVFGHLPSGRPLDELRGRLVRRGIADRVRLRGFIADPVEIMSQIDLLVHTADQESFGRVLVEAMAAGLPVAAAAGGGAAEIVVDGETGLLAPPDDAASLAACVERLAADADLRRSMGEAGRRRAVEQYSLARCVAGVADVYREAVSGSAVSAS